MGSRRSLFFVTCSLLSTLCSAAPTSQPSYKACDTLYLINMMPYPDSTPGAGWDQGFELIPAGQVAARYINADPTVLPGYKLELINTPSEACGRNIITQGLVEYHRQLYYDYSRCVLGVVGLFCSTITDAISRIANHPLTGYVHLTSSGSPVHRNVTEFPHTFSTISSSRVYNKAMIALMKEFGWTRINVVQGTLGVYFRSTVNDFVELVKSELGIEKRVIEIDPGRPFSEVLDVIRTEEGRIGYFTVTNDETAKIMCEVYKTNFSSRYTFFFDHRSLKKILSTPVNCTQQQLIEALEGSFSMRYRLEAPKTSEGSDYRTISGLTFEEYRQEYRNELERFQNETGATLSGTTPWANILHDQVWAMALAANRSLGTFLNHSTDVRAAAEIRNVLTEGLKEIEFNGATGFIRYDEVQEVQTLVNINQIRNGSLVLIGTYDNYNRTLRFVEGFNRSTIPSDTFDTRRQLVPLWLGTIVIGCAGLLAIVVIFIALAIVFLRRKPEIKSMSFFLSFVVLFSSSLLLFPPVINTVQKIFNMDVLPVLCSFNTWLLISGTSIILVTVLVRLFRIFHVFRSYHSTGKYWSDKYLLLYVFVLCSPILLLMVVQSAMDPFTLETERKFISSADNPYIEIHQTCSSNFYNVWLGLSFGYIGLVMMFSIFFAIQTRHIKRKHFKDTKKINMFIFGTCIIYAICIPMWFILLAVGLDTLAFACESIVPLAGAALCQAFLFLPKIFPAFTSRPQPARSRSTQTLTSSVSREYLNKFKRYYSDTTLLNTRPTFINNNAPKKILVKRGSI